MGRGVAGSSGATSRGKSTWSRARASRRQRWAAPEHILFRPVLRLMWSISAFFRGREAHARACACALLGLPGPGLSRRVAGKAWEDPAESGCFGRFQGTSRQDRWMVLRGPDPAATVPYSLFFSLARQRTPQHTAIKGARVVSLGRTLRALYTEVSALE